MVSLGDIELITPGASAFYDVSFIHSIGRSGMSLTVDPRYMKLGALIIQAKAETANYQAAHPTDVHQVKALQHLADALTVVEALLNDIRYKTTP